MTNPWAEMREFTFYFDDGDKARSLLRDADALLAMRDALKVIDIALTKKRAYAHIGRLVSDTLAALPEHLR